jgi:hypothetical protein
MSTSTRNRRKTRTAPATTETAPVAVVDNESCQVCHIPLDEKTMKNHGTEKLPYWMCKKTPECDGRVREARDRELRAEAEAAAAAAEEPAEASNV